MIREVTSLADPCWSQLYRLFCQEFPPETREPDAVLEAEVEGEGALPFRYWVSTHDGAVAGFIRAARLPMGVTFVIHIASDPAFRGKGVGRTLLKHVEAELGRPVICEVEPGTAMEWWTRQGAMTITPTYTQPALRPETDPVSFHLMAIGEVKDPVRAIQNFYREAWGLPADHPFVIRATEVVR